MAYPKPILPLNEAAAEEFLEQLDAFEAEASQVEEIQSIRRQMRARRRIPTTDGH